MNFKLIFNENAMFGFICKDPQENPLSNVANNPVINVVWRSPTLSFSRVLGRRTFLRPLICFHVNAVT